MSRYGERLRAAAEHVDALAHEIELVRFCRNVQQTKETDEAENERRLRQLLAAVDRLLEVERKIR